MAPLESATMFTSEFLPTSLIVVLIPGTGVIFTVSTGLTQGRRASIFASVGCTLGIVPHLLATILGLAAVMHASALAFQVLHRQTRTENRVTKHHHPTLTQLRLFS